MRGVDLHVHLPTGDWLEGCIGPYLPSVRHYFGAAPQPISDAEFRAVYEAADLVGVLLGWDAERFTGLPALPDERIARLCAESGGTFVGFGSVDPLRPDAIARVARMRELGLKGVKLHPTMQGFDPADPELVPFFDAIAEHELIVLTHAGTSGMGAGQPGGQGLRIDLAQPLRFDAIAARHPHLPIVLAHTGWPWHLESLAMALHKRNVHLDISGWRYRYLPEDVRREMRTRLQDQFLFGTDYPMFDPPAMLDEFERLELPEEPARKVLRDNAVRLLGLDGGGG